MDSDYVLLTEKEPMWAKMLMEVLEDNHIPCASLPVYGAALCHKAGKKERFRIFVPEEDFSKASDLLQMLFSNTYAEEQEESDTGTDI